MIAFKVLWLHVKITIQSNYRQPLPSLVLANVGADMFGLFQIATCQSPLRCRVSSEWSTQTWEPSPGCSGPASCHPGPGWASACHLWATLLGVSGTEHHLSTCTLPSWPGGILMGSFRGPRRGTFFASPSLTREASLVIRIQQPQGRVESPRLSAA